jgi:hypothetical protein
MHFLNSARSASLAAAVLLLAACSDQGEPLRPRRELPQPPSLQVAVSCTASVATGSVRCGDAVPAGGGSAAILGGQNEYIRLAAAHASATADTFAIDVTVTNLIPQPLGTTNGASADPAGVRVFFTSGPTATAGGTVTVANADGVATITGADQPYFQYAGLLAQDGVSAAKQWKFQVSGGATTFSFVVLLSTAVQYPDGYIADHPYVLSLNPNEVRTLVGTVFDFRGDVLADPISWSSIAPGTASVSGTQVTAGGARGFAELTASSGPRPGIYTTAVSVCQATLVTSGTSLPSSISGSDCFSSYGDPSGRPTSSYYADLYRVSLTAGQTITVTMDSGDDLDTYLLLAGPTLGELVAGNDDDDEGVLGVGSRLVYTATVTGVYVIEASTFNGLDTGSYTLGVTIS